MDLSIIVVSFNVKDRLRRNLQKLLSDDTEAKFEVFVVDNASTDGSSEMVKYEFPSVRLIENDSNTGFARANNQAFKKAAGDFILLLNPDMEIKDGAIDDMIAWMRDNKQAGIAGCRLFDDNGGEISSVRRFPTLIDQLAIVLKAPHIYPGIINDYLCKNFDQRKASRVDSVKGCFFMIRRSSLERLLPSKRLTRGELLDERYFLWFEEVDLCRQAKEAEVQVWYTPAAECVDHAGRSFAQVGSFKKQIYFRDSMIKYFKKWHPAWQVAVLRIVWPIGLALTLIIKGIGVGKK